MARNLEKIISEITGILVSKLECNGILKCVELVGNELGADGGFVLRVNEIPFLLEMRCRWDPSGRITDNNVLLDFSGQPDSRLFKAFSTEPKLDIIEDTGVSTIDSVSKELYSNIGAKSFISCSMLDDGEYLGELCFFNLRYRTWDEEELELVKRSAGVISNVVARIKLDETMKQLLEETNRRIRDAEETKTRFLNNITNEMRTPLNSAIGMISIMRHNIDNADVMDDCTGRMEVLIKQLMGLLGDCTDTAIMEGHEHLVNRAWVPLESVVSGIRKFIDPYVAGRKQNLEFDYDGDMLIFIDEVKTAKVMINALSCSSRFSDPETDINVTIKAEKISSKQEVLLISIKDQNKNCDRERATQAFEPFSKLRVNSGQFNRVGITMSLIRNTVEIMNGTCEFFSDGNGTELFMSIPIETRGGEETEETSTVNEDNLKYDEMYIGRRILIVEDNVMMGDILATLMGYRGLETDVVVSGRDAIDAYEKQEAFYYDMIFMDIRMPDMDGLETTGVIRNSQKQDSAIIPIIALSSSSMAQEEKDAMAAGMNAYLHKPVNETQLFETINKFLI